ncbi:hypothetical protein Baya_16317 [Bagarius yarrelli]|uniref:Uncharacterized protein n=1 Tax=Bagarius yarrelli TaxID=175774 RepID=A0A556VUZ7_BAGYA|nr:hypothetical protein Baya_16317 [Bagarius yarrelli]
MRAAEADRLANELTSAAAAGDTARAELLLLNGADVNRANRFGRTPVQRDCITHNATAVTTQLLAGSALREMEGGRKILSCHDGVSPSALSEEYSSDEEEDEEDQVLD